MKWDIRPLEGVGPLSFGMDRMEVEKILGKPRIEQKKTETNIMEWRETTIPNIEYENSCIVGINAGKETSTLEMYSNLVFANKIETLTEIERRAGPLFEFYAIIMCFSLDIAFAGFHDNDESQLSVNIYSGGYYTAYKEKSRPISFL